MDTHKTEARKRSLNTTEKVAQLEDPQENEVDSKITADKSPIDAVRLDMINMG